MVVTHFQPDQEQKSTPSASVSSKPDPTLPGSSKDFTMHDQFYCQRCNRRFRNLQAKQQHLQDSTNHYECPGCSYDGTSWNDLKNHYQATGHAIHCQGCRDGKGYWWIGGSQAYQDHLTDNNVCKHCDRHFDNVDNLEQHNLTHIECNVECYGCYRKFRNFGGMMIHLESGACPSGIDEIDLNITAATCYQWSEFITTEEIRDDMLEGYDVSDADDWPFMCPTCEAQFSGLSGLFQHVGTRACSQTMDEGAIKKLVRWLKKTYQ